MLTVRQCMIGETAWFRKLEGEYHYMGEVVGFVSVVDAERGGVRGDREDTLVRRGVPRQARQRLPRGRLHAAVRPVPASLETVPRHDEGRPAVT